MTLSLTRRTTDALGRNVDTALLIWTVNGLDVASTAGMRNWPEDLHPLVFVVDLSIHDPNLLSVMETSFRSTGSGQARLRACPALDSGTNG